MNVFAKDNLYAWCIVPFDARRRRPAERAAMLQRLGLPALAYDWRPEHIPTFDEELAQLRAHDIRLHAFFCLGQFPADEAALETDENVQATLDFLRRHRLATDVWVVYKGDEVADLEGAAAKYDAAARRIDVLTARLNDLGCRVGLYNHGGWDGEPRTMVEILHRLPDRQLGIVYNFHHGHDHLARMPADFQLMLPHLISVNLNGTTVRGTKIQTIGEGEEDRRILEMIRESGYRGPLGILDHRPETDSEPTLRANLHGLRDLLVELGDHEAAATYA